MDCSEGTSAAQPAYTVVQDTAPAAEMEGILTMQLQHTFDEMIKYKLKVKQEDERARKNYIIHHKYLSKIKFIVAFLYMFVSPFIETPYWCAQLLQDDD